MVSASEPEPDTGISEDDSVAGFKRFLGDRDEDVFTSPDFGSDLADTFPDSERAAVQLAFATSVYFLTDMAAHPLLLIPLASSHCQA